MMRPPWAFASSTSSGRGSSAPQLSTSTGLPAVEHRPADVLELGGRRAFDRDIGMRRELVQRHQRAVDAFAVEPGLRLAVVACGGAGQRKSRHAVMQPPCERAPDGAEPAMATRMSCMFRSFPQKRCRGMVYVRDRSAHKLPLDRHISAGKATANRQESGRSSCSTEQFCPHWRLALWPSGCGLRARRDFP